MKSRISRRRSTLWALPVAVLFSTLMTSGAHASCYVSAQERLQSLFQPLKTNVTVLAHRGLWGAYASSQNLIPENSLGSIVAASNARCLDGMELDVKMTSDDVPILMHDYNLGRTTNVYILKSGAAKYDPARNTGYNPTVESLKASQIYQLKLLLPNRSNNSVYGVPEVIDALESWKLIKDAPPIVFDVKTASAVQAVARTAVLVIGSPGLVLAMKVNATLYQSRAAYNADARSIPGIPVFTTNNLSTINVDKVISQWNQGSSDAVEINVKSINGYLQDEFNRLKASGNATGVFNAIPDYPGSNKEFYNNDGSCCYTLADKFYGHERQDLRGSWDYLSEQGFSFITSDDPISLKQYLIKIGRIKNPL